MTNGQSQSIASPIPRDPKQKFWDPEIQTMSRDGIRAIQEDGLRTLVQQVFDRSVPFFQRKLKGAGIASARDIRSVDDLNLIPLTVKQELRESEAEFPVYGDYRFTDPTEAVRLGTSTGSTGNPTVSIWTKHDLWWEYESACRFLWRSGVRPGMTMVHAHPGYLYGGGLMLSGSLEYFGCQNVWVPPPETDAIAHRAIDFLVKLNPDRSLCIFSHGRFMEAAQSFGIPKDDERLAFFQRIPGDGLRTMFDMEDGIPLRTAGLDCYVWMGEGCGHSPGAHLHEDRAIVQAVDPATGKEVPHGEWGSLVVTTLGRDNGMIRYDLEEACKLLVEPCPCGETSIRGVWGGRLSDLMLIQGKRLHSHQFEVALRSVPDISHPGVEFQIVRSAETDGPLAIRIERGLNTVASDDDIAKTCRIHLKQALGVDADVTILPRETLPRSGYKVVRVVRQ